MHCTDYYDEDDFYIGTGFVDVGVNFYQPKKKPNLETISFNEKLFTILLYYSVLRGYIAYHCDLRELKDVRSKYYRIFAKSLELINIINN